MILDTSEDFVISFTGSRSGLTKNQINKFVDILKQFKSDKEKIVFEHGDCIGSDEDSHTLTLGLEIPIKKRPCNLESQRAFTDGGEIISDPEPPLIRNHKLVDDCDQLIACPDGHQEKLRSGTWATIRYAKKVKKPIIIIWPDGTTSYINSIEG